MGCVFSAALAYESPVPLYSPEEAMRLAEDPVRAWWMRRACERIAGIWCRRGWCSAAGSRSVSGAIWGGNSREPLGANILCEERQPIEYIFEPLYSLKVKVGSGCLCRSKRIAGCVPGPMAQGGVPNYRSKSICAN